MNKKVLVIVQARLGSTRFPYKVLQKIGKKTVIEMIVDRISKSKNFDNLIVATTNKSIRLFLFRKTCN